ncbi:acyltransferase family protein [Holdemanella porci]|uniref:acyltransferase family protein n=1 Tax=Holdemanella porci TaxID=2652276 RepID=UPI003F919B6A
MEKKHYYGIDWLRAMACIGIVMMHIQSNNTYHLSGFIAEKMIPSFTNFTFLFMTISAFGMCVGYYAKVKSGKVNWVDFYKKRYMKVLPFLAVVVLMDIVFNHDLTSIVEAIPNLTLTRGFFPNQIEQIGVAWFLGLVFVFYAIFPLFCAMLNSKKSGWVFFAVSLLLNFVVASFYGMGRTNIIYSLPFFIAGGLIYLYRDKVKNWHIYLPLAIFSSVLYYLVGGVYSCLLVSISFLLLGISIGGGYSKIVSFISGISMEIYLSHMVVFRLVEKMRLNIMFGNGWLQYFITVILALVGATCFSVIVKKFIEIAEKKLVGKE